MEVFGTNRLGQFDIKNGIANNMLLENGGSLRVEENDFAYNTTVDSGGLLEVMDGGTATGVDKKAGGKLIVSTNALEVSGTNSKGQFSIKDGVSKNYELDDGSGLIVMEDTQAGFAPIFPDTCYHLTHYWPAAVDIPVASDNPVHYADAIRYNARTPLQGSLLPLTRLV